MESNYIEVMAISVVTALTVCAFVIWVANSTIKANSLLQSARKWETDRGNFAKKYSGVKYFIAKDYSDEDPNMYKVVDLYQATHYRGSLIKCQEYITKNTNIA